MPPPPGSHPWHSSQGVLFHDPGRICFLGFSCCVPSPQSRKHRRCLFRLGSWGLRVCPPRSRTPGAVAAADPLLTEPIRTPDLALNTEMGNPGQMSKVSIVWVGLSQSPPPPLLRLPPWKSSERLCPDLLVPSLRKQTDTFSEQLMD